MRKRALHQGSRGVATPHGHAGGSVKAYWGFRSSVVAALRSAGCCSGLLCWNGGLNQLAQWPTSSTSSGGRAGAGREVGIGNFPKLMLSPHLSRRDRAPRYVDPFEPLALRGSPKTLVRNPEAQIAKQDPSTGPRPPGPARAPRATGVLMRLRPPAAPWAHAPWLVPAVKGKHPTYSHHQDQRTRAEGERGEQRQQHHGRYRRQFQFQGRRKSAGPEVGT